jgi:hypothetical protein
MKARSITGKSTSEIFTALEQCLSGGFKPTLAIVFISIKQDRVAVCERLHQEEIDIVGASSCGEFINGYQDEGSIVMLLLDLSRDAYSIVFSAMGDRTVSDTGAEVAGFALRKYTRPALILCSTGLSEQGEFLDGESLVRSIEKVVGPQVTIFGGMAGDDASFTGTYVFTYNQETDKGIAALVLDEEKISLTGMAISGWTPIGISRKVTSSKGNRVYAIDDQPAPEMYLRFLGKDTKAEHDNYKLFQEVGVHYPFQVETASGVPVMRTPVSIDPEENALVFDFNVPQGASLRFSMPPEFDIVEKVLTDAAALKNEKQAEADALLIFSCAGRVSALGPLATAENEGLYEIFKAPMAGFFTYGEYGRALNARQEFHSTTCCLVALKEK